MRITLFRNYLISYLTIIAALGAGIFSAIPAFARDTTIVIDDFESEAPPWTLNDNIRQNRPNVLAELVSLSNVPPGTPGVPGSKKSGLFTFKSAAHSWASASIRVDGNAWKENGAQRLTFYLNAGGNTQGFKIQLRRLVNGQNDEVFRLPLPVLLDKRNWRKVVIPLSDFKSDKGNLLDRLSNVYSLQVVMDGNWDTRFFSIDQMQVEGTVQPKTASTESVIATADNSSADITTPSPNTSAINVDYLKLVGGVRSTADATVGATGAESALPLVKNRDFRVAIRELKPNWVRIDAGALSEMTDSSRPSFDFSNLVASAKSARSIGAKVLLVISDHSNWGLNADGYAAFAVQAAKAVNHGSIIVSDFELATMASGRDIGDATITYNTARRALKKVSSKYRVGGITSTSRDPSILPVFLAATDGLDFLTIRDFGRDDSSNASIDQFSAARNMQRLSDAAHDLDNSPWRQARIYVITNLEPQPASSDKTPLLQMPAAAWWSTYLMNVSRLADQIFHNDATNPQWGLLDEQVRAFPSYYAMWMWNTFVPSGSQRVATEVKSEGITAMGVNSPTAHNLLLANTTNSTKTAQIAIRGFPILRKARIWMYDNPEKQPYLQDLPNSPYQTVKLAPYSVAVIQFIEPPKKAKK